MSPSSQSHIAVFAPYLGPLPAHFPLWLRSAKRNPLIDWYVLTDQITEPIRRDGNVFYISTSLAQLQEIFRQGLRREVALTSGYKLCDLRPMYSLLFPGFNIDLHRYRFWGHCDLDVVFGELGPYIGPGELDRYDRIFDLGHLSFYRNVPEVNNLYRLTDWERVVSSENNVGFDEHQGISRAFLQAGLRVRKTRADVVDIDPKFNEIEVLPPHSPLRRHVVVVWSGRCALVYPGIRSCAIRYVAYVHFQKRYVPRSEEANFWFHNEELRALPECNDLTELSMQSFSGIGTRPALLERLPHVARVWWRHIEVSKREWADFKVARWKSALLQGRRTSGSGS